MTFLGYLHDTPLSECKPKPVNIYSTQNNSIEKEWDSIDKEMTLIQFSSKAWNKKTTDSLNLNENQHWTHTSWSGLYKSKIFQPFSCIFRECLHPERQSLSCHLHRIRRAKFQSDIHYNENSEIQVHSCIDALYMNTVTNSSEKQFIIVPGCWLT